MSRKAVGTSLKRHFSRLRLVFTPSEGAACAHSTRRLTETISEPEKTALSKEHVDGKSMFPQELQRKKQHTDVQSGPKINLALSKPSPITYFPRKWVNISYILSKWIRLIPSSSATERRSQERSLLSTARNKQTHAHLKLREQEKIKKRREWWKENFFLWQSKWTFTTTQASLQKELVKRKDEKTS